MDAELKKAFQKQQTIRQKFRRYWPNYLWQTGLAALLIVVVAIVAQGESRVVIASMGSTAFICFALPKSYSAQTRNVIGGHLVALMCGGLLTITGWPFYLEFPIAAGLAMFLMVALDTEHAPAVGTALAVTMHEVDWAIALAIMLAVLLMSQARYILRHHLKDLV